MSVEFVVQLENRPGALAHFARALASRGVDIRAISGGGLGSLGYAVVTTDDAEATREVIATLGYRYAEGHPVIVEISDRPGALADVATKLESAGINIGGLTIVGRSETTVEIAISTDDPTGARRVLGLDAGPP